MRPTRRSRRWSDMTGLLLKIAFVWAVIVAALHLFQRRLIYYPSRQLAADPTRIGRPFEELWLTSDEDTVHGWLVRARPTDGDVSRPSDAPARGTILFCHGNAGNISHRLALIDRYCRLGCDVLIFDYPGYGRSTGRPSESRNRRAAAAAFDHLVVERGVSADRIVLLGRSLGGGVAAPLAVERRPAGLILESTFTSLPRLGTSLYPGFALPPLIRDRYDVASCLERLEVPLLIAHSNGDRVVPYEHGRELFEAARRRAPDRVTFLPLRGGHDEGPEVTGAAYDEGLAAFLDQVLSDGSR